MTVQTRRLMASGWAAILIAALLLALTSHWVASFFLAIVVAGWAQYGSG